MIGRHLIGFFISRDEVLGFFVLRFRVERGHIGNLAFNIGYFIIDLKQRLQSVKAVAAEEIGLVALLYRFSDNQIRLRVIDRQIHHLAARVFQIGDLLGEIDGGFGRKRFFRHGDSFFRLDLFLEARINSAGIRIARIVNHADFGIAFRQRIGGNNSLVGISEANAVGIVVLYSLRRGGGRRHEEHIIFLRFVWQKPHKRRRSPTPAKPASPPHKARYSRLPLL